MKLKAIGAAFAALVMVGSMAACGNSSSSSTSSSGKTELTFWHNATTGAGKKYWNSLAKQFEKKHSNVTIKLVAIQDADYDGKLQTALQDPDSAPDIFLQRGGQKMTDMVDAGQLMDLTNLVSSETKNSLGSVLDTDKANGKIYSVSYTVSPGGIWYSKDLFAKAGISETPTTWEELKEDITKLKDADITPIALGAKEAWTAGHWWYWAALRECSTSTFNQALKSKKFTGSCWTKAGNDVLEIKNLGAFNDGYLTTSAQQGAGSASGLLANHKAAMELTGSWEPGIVKSLTPDGKELSDLGYFAFPTIEGGDGDSTAVMGGSDALSCSVNAPKACAEFLNFMATTKNQIAYSKAFSALPANKNAQSAVTNSALLEALDVYNNSSSYSIWLDTKFGSNVGNALNSGVVNLLAGKGTAADIVKSATSAAAKE